MYKAITAGLLTAVFAFFVAVTFVNAQTVSPTTTPTPSSNSSSQNTPGTPNTGF